MLALLRGSHVIRHGVQTVVREPLPPWPPREGSTRLTAFSAAREPLRPIAFLIALVPRTAARMFRGTNVCKKRRLKDDREDVRDVFWAPRPSDETPNDSEIHTQNTLICVSERENIRTHPEQTFHGQLEVSTKNESPKKLQQINRTGPPGSSVHNSHLHPAQARPPLGRAPSRSFCAPPTDARKIAALSPSAPT